MIAAVVQMTSTDDVDANLERAARGIARAAAAGADLVALPENFPFMREEGAGPNPAAQPLDGPVVAFLRERAREHGIVLAGGTFPEAIPGDDRVYNTSVVVNPDGEVAAVYRKIHLFDVDLPGASLQESKGVVAGEDLALADTPVGRLGLSVCYDLRFPELYRELTRRGATILLVPSAFTVPTGSDHWQVLLRARAIENQAFVLASAQYGRHSERRHSYGRSLIVDPWGSVLASVPDGGEVALAELDAERQQSVRGRLPALRHRRL
ncbi:MAG: carbon-nitrogen hydrolase family protein [Deltaproteobacteria bacterium]|nr:carbon-nitrogen hydrolase family protein [Deltaproteobacteria bacterium]MBW2415567.1 carbon-nitrogen hydrolase family protein [Deltaproteobacteria bacterium]